MSFIHLPWVAVTILVPLLGAVWVWRTRDPAQAQRDALVVKCLTLVCSVGAWLSFIAPGDTREMDGVWVFVETGVPDALARLGLEIDALSAPLLPLAAIVHLATAVGTLRTKARRFSFSGSLVAESILLATFCTRSPWLIIALLAAGGLPPLLELRSRGRSTRVYSLHMGLSISSLAIGEALVQFGSGSNDLVLAGSALIAVGVVVRSGIFPLHLWVADLFASATFGTALLFVTPMVGAYAAIRLLLPTASALVLEGVLVLSVFTAVYSAGMALVQREARRFFSYLFLSHASLVMLGLAVPEPIALTGGLSVWISVALALTGFGLTLRSIEARTGPLSLARFHGLYKHTPMLAVFFLLTGLAGVGFPGTLGFAGVELLVEGVVEVLPQIGVAVVLAAALNGVAVILAYSRVFTGSTHETAISLRSRLPERLAVLGLTALILGGGLLPQPAISSRHEAALQILGASDADEGGRSGVAGPDLEETHSIAARITQKLRDYRREERIDR